MAVRKFSIRHQLLLLGALATASIWTGALLQYAELRQRSVELGAVRTDLASADRYAQAARAAAQERGLSNGWLSQAGSGDSRELASVRARVDTQIATLTEAATDEVPPAVAARRDDLSRIRGRIERRELPATEAFGYYTSLIGAMQDTAARRLATSMIAVSLPYEHVNHLQRLTEELAQMRGLLNGALRAGSLAPPTRAAIAREFVRFEDAMRLYQQSVPEAAAARLAASIDAPAVQAATGHLRTLIAFERLDALALDPTGWWSLATEAVDTLGRASQAESAAISQQALDRMATVEREMRWTVAALVVLGVITLVMVLSTVGRIVVGLDRLLEGLDAVGVRRDFDARIDASGADEFGKISGGINKLIAIAGSVVEEQETLSQTDALTGAVNRRGFDRQLDARTTAARAHAVQLALVMVDVDRFKSINDELGHPMGDLVLKGLAQVLRATLRPDDVLARFGGEEFVALLPGCPLDAASEVAEKLRAAVARHDFGIGRPVTASFGVAAWNRGQTPAALVAEADSKLYAAKAAGRNRVMPAVPVRAVA